MSRRTRAAPAATLLLATLVACSKAPPAPDGPGVGRNTIDAPANAVTPQASPSLPTAEPPAQPPGDDPATFVPLASAAVKDAIHRALRTGATQRWQDGKLSGYAVPSLATGANGCRAVRYTVDQRPGAGYEAINACDASR